MHILFYLQTAFSLWMLVDAAQRGARFHWYWIIMMPFGELAYFFAVKIHDPEFRTMKTRLLTKRVSLKQLRYQASSSPSVRNKVLLAQALYDHGQFEEGAELFREVLKTHDDEKRALYGLGLCLRQLQQAKQAVATLEQLLEMDFGYENYTPCVELAGIYWEAGRKDDAIELMRRVVGKSQQLMHKAELAEYLHAIGESQEARALLEPALEDHDNSPAYVRKRDRAWARKARSTLKQLAG